MDDNSLQNNHTRVPPVFHLDWSRYAVPINGFLMPLIAIVTLVNNSFVVTILLSREMRCPTNALLAALAVSDTLTSVCPLPCFVYFYTVGQRYLDWVPYPWCSVYFILTDYLPTVFHTASIWLTVSLAAQRYVYVCCPVESTGRRRLCSMRGSVCIVVAVYLAAVVSQLCRFGELTFSPVQMQSLVNSTDPDEEDNVTAVVEVTACQYELAPFVARHETLYFNIYYWSRVLLIHVIPCSALVFLNSTLVRTMRTAHQRRCQMTSRPVSTLARRRLTDTTTEVPASEYMMQTLRSPSSVQLPPRQHGGLFAGGGDSPTRATVMLVIVVGVFLLVEVPLSILLLLVIIENTLHVDVFSYTTRHNAALFVNCCIAITYPLNLFVYCTMSERFRRMFCHIFTRTANFDDAQPPLARASTRRTVRI